MMRPGDAPVILPKAGEVSVLFGPLKLGLFGRLNASPRSCREWRSRIVNTLLSDKSRLIPPGLVMIFRPELPNAPCALAWNAAVLKYCRMRSAREECGRLQSPTTLAR